MSISLGRGHNSKRHHSRSQGWERWLAAAVSPKRSLNTLEAPLPISRLGRVACPRCLAQEITQYSGSASPDLKVGKVVRKIGSPGKVELAGCWKTHSQP